MIITKIVAILLLLIIQSSAAYQVPEITSMTCIPLDIETDDIVELERMAEVEYSAGFYSSALPFYEKLIELSGENVQSCAHISTCLKSVENYEESLRYALRALELIQWKSIADDVTGYEFEVLEATHNVAEISLLTGIMEPVSSLPYWDAVDYYLEKRQSNNQRDLEFLLIAKYGRALAYDNAQKSEQFIKLLDDIAEDERFEQLYDIWCIKHETTDLGTFPYEIYQWICNIE